MTPLPATTVTTSPEDDTLHFQIEAIQDLPSIPGYAIKSELARGGMGRILAGHELALQREVAIKTLLPGSDASRFITEARITAQLPHPSIPPIHALGTLPDSTPYLAMKLVRGRTLAEELKARPNPLHDLPRFLHIFEQVAQAVGFAHAQNIIHRDLKPANIMVGAFGEVQVMDWGLAKEIDISPQKDAVQGGIRTESNTPADLLSSAQSDTIHHFESNTLPPALPCTIPYETPNNHGDQTRSGTILGTPNYMAPEQARGELASPQSDVFALGGILCAILTGQAVFGGTTVIETLKLASSGDTSDARKRIDASGADRELTELAKQCLSPIRTGRPSDGQAVANLVAGYRGNVELRLKQAETAKTQALVREAEQGKRRRVMQVAACIITFILATGLAVSVWQMNRALNAEEQAQQNEAKAILHADSESRERIRAENNEKRALKEEQIAKEVKTLLFEGLLKQVDTYQQFDAMKKLGDKIPFSVNPSVKTLLDRASQILDVKRLASTYPNDPELQAELLEAVGTSYRAIGDYQKAIGFLKRCIDLKEQIHGKQHPKTLKCINILAIALIGNGQHSEAITQLEALLASKNPDSSHILSNVELSVNLAGAYCKSGMQQKALTLLRKISADLQQANNVEDSVRVKLALALGVVQSESGLISDAVTCYEQARKLAETCLGPDHPDTLLAASSLGAAYRKQRRFSDARQLLNSTLSKLVQVLGEDHPQVLQCTNGLAVVHLEMGNAKDALPLLENILPVLKKKLGPTHSETLACQNSLVGAYFILKRQNDALELMQVVVRDCKESLGETHPHTITALNNLGSMWFAKGELERALPFLNSAARGVQCLNFMHENAPRIMDNVIFVSERHRQYEQAERWRQIWLVQQKKSLGADSAAYAQQLADLAINLIQQKKMTNAETILLECLAIRKRKIPDSWLTFYTQYLLGYSLLNQKKYSQAEPYLVQGYTGMKKLKDQIPPISKTRFTESLDHLILLYIESGKPDEAKKWQDEKDKLPEPNQKK